jgi:hypothetical protein
MDERDAFRRSPKTESNGKAAKRGFWRKAKSEWRTVIRDEAKDSDGSYTWERMKGKEDAMQTKAAQWILWAITMIVFSALTLSGHFELLALAIVLSSLVWFTVVPRTTSR